MLLARQPPRELSAISSVGFGGAFMPGQAESIPLAMSRNLPIGFAVELGASHLGNCTYGRLTNVK